MNLYICLLIPSRVTDPRSCDQTIYLNTFIYHRWGCSAVSHQTSGTYWHAKRFAPQHHTVYSECHGMHMGVAVEVRTHLSSGGSRIGESSRTLRFLGFCFFGSGGGRSCSMLSRGSSHLRGKGKKENIRPGSVVTFGNAQDVSTERWERCQCYDIDNACTVSRYCRLLFFVAIYCTTRITIPRSI